VNNICSRNEVKTGKGGELSWHRKDKEKAEGEKARARQAEEEVWVEDVVWVRMGTVSAQVAEKKSLISGGIPALT
jgi:hypothetical protein